MANVLGVVWFVAGSILFHTALLVWVALMLPNPVERARARIESRPGRSLLWGALFALGTLLVAGQFLKSGRGGAQLVGWLLTGPFWAAAAVGGAAWAQLLGARMQAVARREAALSALVGGALCASLAGWLPILGWFIYFPITLLIGAGAGAAALLRRRDAASAEQRRPAAAGGVSSPAGPAEQQPAGV